MLNINGLRNYYFLPDLYDMRCGAQRGLETIRVKTGHHPYNGDVFIYMSKNRKTVKLVHFENNAFYVHEKRFKRGYRFMKLEVDGAGRLIYSMAWKDLVALLECPVIDVLKIRSDIICNAG